jgi:hypothetical protein
MLRIISIGIAYVWIVFFGSCWLCLCFSFVCPFCLWFSTCCDVVATKGFELIVFVTVANIIPINRSDCCNMMCVSVYSMYVSVYEYIMYVL